MKRKVIIVLVFILVFTTGMLHKKASAEAPIIEIPTDARGQIAYYAAIFNVKENDLYLVLKCESGLSNNPKGSNDGGRAKGIAQYHKPTWDSFSKSYQKEYGGEILNRDNQRDQIELTAYAFKKGWQHHWSCFSKTRGV